jgi:hypothetical protein
LADLFKLLSCADPSSAVPASLRRRSKHEIGDGLAHRWQAWLRRWSVDSFLPPRFCEAAMLEEGVSNHRHERVTVKALPGSSLEVVGTSSNAKGTTRYSHFIVAPVLLLGHDCRR